MAARQAGAFGLVVVAGAAGGIDDALVEKPWPWFPGDEWIPGARSFRTVDGTGGSGRSVRDLLFDLAFGLWRAVASTT